MMDAQTRAEIDRDIAEYRSRIENKQRDSQNGALGMTKSHSRSNLSWFIGLALIMTIRAMATNFDKSANTGVVVISLVVTCLMWRLVVVEAERVLCLYVDELRKQ